MDEQRQNQGAGASIVSATGLTLLGTTCYVLPIALVALGAEGKETKNIMRGIDEKKSGVMGAIFALPWC